MLTTDLYIATGAPLGTVAAVVAAASGVPLVADTDDGGRTCYSGKGAVVGVDVLRNGHGIGPGDGFRIRVQVWLRRTSLHPELVPERERVAARIAQALSLRGWEVRVSGPLESLVAGEQIGA
jgi:hypothetical protein